MSTKKKKIAINGSGPAAPAVAVKPGSRKGARKLPEPIADVAGDEHLLIDPELIDLSPFNYRKHFKPGKLEELAVSIATHGLIEEITVRRVVAGRYELVVGERRLRASLIAKVKEIPCRVRVMTDEQVIEAQYAENYDREDPHPMDEAHGIGNWISIGRSVKEIAARIGRAEKFVYERTRLLKLIDEIKEMFLADCFTMLEALDISALSPESQASFYETYCKSWKESENFSVSNLKYVLANYRCSLREASFDIHDATLLPKMGACTSCPFNTASTTSLFPAEESRAACTNGSCFEQKGKISFWNQVASAVKDSGVTALIYQHEINDEVKEALEHLGDGIVLKTYEAGEITELSLPSMPTIEDYTEVSSYEADEDEADEDERWGDDGEDPDENWDGNFNEEDDDCDEDEADDRVRAGLVEQVSGERERVPMADGELPQPGNPGEDLPNELSASEPPASEAVFDEEGYKDAMERYESRMTQYRELTSQHALHVGMKIGYNRRIVIITFIILASKRNGYGASKVERLTAKEVQQRIKAGTVTVDQLEGEVERIEEWTSRQEVLDREKVQASVHAQFKDFVAADSSNRNLTDADIAGLRWMIYECLSYSDKNIVEKTLFPGRDSYHAGDLGVEHFASMTDSDVAFLIRTAVIGRDASKSPHSIAGRLLYNMAKRWIDTEAIEAARQEVAETRRGNQRQKIDSLQRRIQTLDPERPKALPIWASSLAVSDCDTLEEFLRKYKREKAFADSQDDAFERAVFAAKSEIKKEGFASIQPEDSVTEKMVVYIPRD